MCSSGRLQQPGQFLGLPGLHQFQVIEHDLPGHAVLGAAAFELQQQALAQVGCGHARRIERLHHANGFLDVLQRETFLGRHFFGARKQITVFVQVADHAVGGVPDFFAEGDQGQLRMEVIGKRDRRGKEGFKRGLFDVFGCGAFVTGIEIVVEVGAEIDFVEGIGWRGRLGSFRGGGARGCVDGCVGGGARRALHVFDSSDVGRIDTFGGVCAIRHVHFHGTGGHIQNRLVGGIGHALGFEQRLQFFGRQLFAALSRLFEDRVLGDFRLNHVLQLQTVQLQQADHLHQPGREDLLLLDPYLQSGRE